MGVFLGVFLFWPAAVLLLAGYANPQRRPIAAKIMGGAGALVTAAVLAGSALFVWDFVISP
ncbi:MULTISPECIES: hypothetical protein [Streptomyces]|uniref:Uncharacterized protein n=1 Tax=Streptomyces noboritoensis TaxID=67337 RepID=A0ABV6T9T3_9ACTN|nr:hypothetical protein [Streptomyces melanogenes]